MGYDNQNNQMHLCACVSEERGGGESAGSEALSLLSYTLKYVRLADLDRHGESVGSEALSHTSDEDVRDENAACVAHIG